MVKDSIQKMRALVSMKTTLITSLQADLRTAELRIIHLDDRVRLLEQESAWWKDLDKEMERTGDRALINMPIETYVPTKIKD